MVSGSKASWWPITSTAPLPRNVISSNIHVIFNHLHYKTYKQKAHRGQTGGVLDKWVLELPFRKNDKLEKHTKNFMKCNQGKTQGPGSGTKPPQPLALVVE